MYLVVTSTSNDKYKQSQKWFDFASKLCICYIGSSTKAQYNSLFLDQFDRLLGKFIH